MADDLYLGNCSPFFSEKRCPIFQRAGQLHYLIESFIITVVSGQDIADADSLKSPGAIASWP